MLAVDRSERFVAKLVREAERRGLAQLTAQVGEVEELRLEPGSLDRAFARWLFCFLPAPGPVVERVVSAVHESWRRSGGDLDWAAACRE